MTVPLSPAQAEVPAFRREPYRILFPLGMLLAWAGILHWLLLATGLIEAYRSIFHAFAQIEGFLACFAAGFLFTLIPRRTATSPPARWQMAVAIVAPVAVTIVAWFERWALSQIPWLAFLAMLIQFAVSRFRSPGASLRIPNSFVWVVLALLMGVAGSILAGVGAALGERWFWLHEIGRAMVLQGMFTGLVLGVGGMLLPVITRGVPPLEGGSPSIGAKAGHLILGVLFLATFFLEALVSTRLGFALRAAITLAVLLVSAEIWRRPSLPGLHRRLIWLAAWSLPAGYAWVAILPAYAKAGLHVVFIGCFALLAFCVSIHVVLSHGGASQLLDRWPAPVALMGALLLGALAMRVLVDVDPAHVYRWLGGAAAAFLAATIVWGYFTATCAARSLSERMK
jgi:uncharacterized protein involved in response to NO